MKTHSQASTFPSSCCRTFIRDAPHRQLFRRHTGNLDLIVHMYNNVEITLLPVERPLLQLQLVRNNIIPGRSYRISLETSNNNFVAKHTV